MHRNSHSNESLFKSFILDDIPKNKTKHIKKRQKILQNKHNLKRSFEKQRSIDSASPTQISIYETYTFDSTIVSESLDYFGQKLMCSDKKLLSLCEKCWNDWNNFLTLNPAINLQDNQENTGNNVKLFDFKGIRACSTVSLDDVEVVQDSELIPQVKFFIL